MGESSENKSIVKLDMDYYKTYLAPTLIITVSSALALIALPEQIKELPELEILLFMSTIDFTSCIIKAVPNVFPSK